MSTNLERKIDVSIESTIEKLQYNCKSLGEQLIRAANDLEKNGIKSNVNTLGEVQSQGNTIDRLCGRFGVLKDLFEIMEAEKMILAREKEKKDEIHEN